MDIDDACVKMKEQIADVYAVCISVAHFPSLLWSLIPSVRELFPFQNHLKPLFRDLEGKIKEFMSDGPVKRDKRK